MTGTTSQRTLLRVEQVLLGVLAIGLLWARHWLSLTTRRIPCLSGQETKRTKRRSHPLESNRRPTDYEKQ